MDLTTKTVDGYLGRGQFTGDLAPDGSFVVPYEPGKIVVYGSRPYESRGFITVPFGITQWIDFTPRSGIGVLLVWDRESAGSSYTIFRLDPQKLTLGPAVPLPATETAYWAALRPGTDEVFVFGGDRLDGIDSETGASFQIRLQDEPSNSECYFPLSFDWSRDGRFLYVITESGFFVVDAVTRSVASHVPPSIAPGCDFVLDPSQPRVFVVNDVG